MFRTRARRFGLALAAAAGAIIVAAPASALSISPSAFVTPVLMLDRCEPDSFNAAFGPGTCVGDGHVTVGAFIATLQQRGAHPLWRFIPRLTAAVEGGTVAARNVGGEEHTFTEVAAFGGGFVAPLNALSRNPVPAPECALTLPNGDLVPTGGAFDTLVGPGGTVVASAGGRVFTASSAASIPGCGQPSSRSGSAHTRVGERVGRRGRARRPVSSFSLGAG